MTPYQRIQNQRAIMGVIRNHEWPADREEIELVDALDDLLEEFDQDNKPLSDEDERWMREILARQDREHEALRLRSKARKDRLVLRRMTAQPTAKD